MTKYYKIYLMINDYIRLNIYLKLVSQNINYECEEKLKQRQTEIQTLFRIKHDYLRNIELNTLERYFDRYPENFIKNLVIEKKHMLEYDDKSIYENHPYMRLTPTKMFDK